MRLSDTPVSYRLPPPVLGEHTRAVLTELLKKSPAEIEALREERVI